MAPQRKATAEAPTPAAAKKTGAGGAGRGARPEEEGGEPAGCGRRWGGEANADGGADLLGPRAAKKPKTAEAAVEECITWVYERHDDEDKSTPVVQQQRRGGRVQWFGGGEGATVTLLEKGPEIYDTNGDLIAERGRGRGHARTRRPQCKRGTAASCSSKSRRPTARFRTRCG